tara:strand:+ start:5068 stop:5448 length:381 start_codon:yes stop_codon:yes gene_type:complete
MNFQNSIKTCFKKFFDFKGRASRSEFWYFYLFSYGIVALLFLLTSLSIIQGSTAWTLGIIFIVVIFFPWIAVTARRLHDIGKSGWWQLISGIPYVGIIGGIVLLVWWCTEGEKKKNKYGKPIKLKR